MKCVLFAAFCYRFTTILSIDHRREYKTIFDKDYAEYRILHKETERVSKIFRQLEGKLKNEEHLRSEGHTNQKVKVS